MTAELSSLQSMLTKREELFEQMQQQLNEDSMSVGPGKCKSQYMTWQPGPGTRQPGPGKYFMPRRVMPLNSRHEGPTCGC